MHNRISYFLLALAVGCQSNSSQQDTSDSTQSRSASELASVSDAPDTLCFWRNQQRDTVTLRLITNGQQATGYIDSKVYEKDRAQGPFEGTIHNNQINANWKRSGEGVTQPYALDLTLNGNTISWQEGERVEQQGKWVLKEPATGYTYVLTKTNCPPEPLR
ncbi:hypothetical protein [Spirosoma areae]